MLAVDSKGPLRNSSGGPKGRYIGSLEANYDREALRDACRSAQRRCREI